MPKAIQINEKTAPLVQELGEWPVDETLYGMFYVEDVQFPHGYVPQAIITKETFAYTFKCDKSEEALNSHMVHVDYL